jgi:hypothetical protein
MIGDIEVRNVAGRALFLYGGQVYDTRAEAFAARQADLSAMNAGGGGGYSTRGGKRGPGLLSPGISRKALGSLRSIVSPVKTVVAGPVQTHAAAGTLTSTITVQSPIPAGAVLYVQGLTANDTLDLIEVDGTNIFTGGSVPLSAVSPASANTDAAVGILIDRPVNQSIRTTTTAGAAGVARSYLVAASLEVERRLDACDCD